MSLKSLKKGFRPGSLFFVGLLGLSLVAFRCADGGDHQLVEESNVLAAAPDTIPAPDTTPVTVELIGVGDMMLGTNYPSASYLPPEGGRTMLSDVEAILQDADITVGNLEGTILDSGGTPKRCNNPAACYVFRSPESYGQHFAKAGFDFLSLANNHSGDMGAAGRAKTKEVLNEQGIKYAGLAGSDEMAIIEKDGITYGFCAFAPNRGTCDIRNIPRAVTIVKQLAEQTDIVIVSFHGGAEGSSHQHVPRATETYYGENRGDVYKFSHALIDAGADVIFGHGPHVTRAMELYQDRLICYSLGNFCTYGRFNVRGVNGIAPIVKVTLDKEGVFQEGMVTPIYQMKTHGPKVDDQKRAISVLQELTKADFPETSLVIGDDGRLSKKQ
jgi:poly-gamma-glutamate capsule biosynthesis protein CapA/YwtB (metallophosphatase superfamily)